MKFWRRSPPPVAEARSDAGIGRYITSSPTITVADLDRAARAFLEGRKDEFAGHVLALPDWFDVSLDADAPEWRAQQMRLWREVTGRDVYDPDKDEDTPEIADLESFVRPAFYTTGSTMEAGLHLLAMGHILMRSGVPAGGRVIEYGAGFGQNALAFARLGMKVDTVDIASGFCGAVSAQAKAFGVDLTAHRQPFGYNPAGEPGAYDLVLFYESFHHCLEFKGVIPRLRDMLKPGGRIIMAGEPIVRAANDLMPYPWGIRLDWENVAIMRIRGWMELGFHEDYLVRQFADAGMSWRLWPDPNAHTAQVYEFRRWNEPIELAGQTLTIGEEAGWHGIEPTGRWTRDHAEILVPAHDGKIVVSGTNYHPVTRSGRMSLGGQSVPFEAECGANVEVVLDGAPKGELLKIDTNVTIGGEHDPRQLGVFIHRVSPA